MKNKKNIILAAILAMFSIGISSANANSLTQMDIKKSSVADTVDVTFYTTDVNPNTVVTKKSNNRYVVLMPNVSSNSSVTPNFGGMKDLITDVNVKHVDDGIGGYTKVTFNTTKPVKIQTYTKKTAPLTKAQQDYKNLIAQNSKYDPDKKMENFIRAKFEDYNWGRASEKSVKSSVGFFFLLIFFIAVQLIYNVLVSIVQESDLFIDIESFSYSFPLCCL